MGAGHAMSNVNVEAEALRDGINLDGFTDLGDYEGMCLILNGVNI